MVTRDDIIREARAWKGARWKHLGRGPGGLDCAGLVLVVGGKLGLVTDDVGTYPRRPDGTFLSYFRDRMDPIPLAMSGPGDVVTFSDRNHPCHCGILTVKYGERAVVHAHAKRKMVMEETLDQAGSVVGRPVFAFRFRGLGD